jgi:hypothetical protein
MATANSGAAAARGIAAMRAAEALLRTLGGTTVIVRVPLLIAEAGTAGELGLAGAASEDIALSPVVVRTSSPQRETEILISAGSIARAREIREATAVRDFFATALGIFVEERLLKIHYVQVDEVGGVPYLYRLKVGE